MWKQTRQVTLKEVNVYEDPFAYFADVVSGKHHGS